MNLENMEVSKVWGEGGCGDQEKYNRMVMTANFVGFGMTSKEGKYLLSIPKVISRHG